MTDNLQRAIEKIGKSGLAAAVGAAGLSNPYINSLLREAEWEITADEAAKSHLCHHWGVSRGELEVRLRQIRRTNIGEWDAGRVWGFVASGHTFDNNGNLKLDADSLGIRL